MNIENVNLLKILNENDNALIYSGPLWAEGISGVVETLKKRMEMDKIPAKITQKIFSVLIEQLNNMLMYSAENIQFEFEKGIKTDFPKGSFILGKEENNFFVQTGNVIKNEYVELVKNRIDYLNTLDKNEIRKYYKEQMKSENDNPQSKGAGLGFIEIARRVSSKIEYSFTPYRENMSFFTFYAIIGGDGDEY